MIHVAAARLFAVAASLFDYAFPAIHEQSAAYTALLLILLRRRHMPALAKTLCRYTDIVTRQMFRDARAARLVTLR